MTKLKICSTAIAILLLTEHTAARLQRIHWISTLGSNAFILETDSSLYMIDAGYPRHEKPILDTIAALHKRLRLIILTHGHFDHYGCARAVKARTGALIGIHRLDARYLCEGTTPIDSVNIVGFFGRLVLPLAERIWKPDPVCPDIEFEDGDSLDQYGLHARIIHTPGHTPGSSCIIVEDSIAFVGDVITNSPRFDKQRYYACNWRQIDSSLVKLCRRRFQIVYIGHWGRATNKDKLMELIDGR